MESRTWYTLVCPRVAWRKRGRAMPTSSPSAKTKRRSRRTPKSPSSVPSRVMTQATPSHYAQISKTYHGSIAPNQKFTDDTQMEVCARYTLASPRVARRKRERTTPASSPSAKAMRQSRRSQTPGKVRHRRKECTAAELTHSPGFAEEPPMAEKMPSAVSAVAAVATEVRAVKPVVSGTTSRLT